MGMLFLVDLLEEMKLEDYEKLDDFYQEKICPLTTLLRSDERIKKELVDSLYAEYTRLNESIALFYLQQASEMISKGITLEEKRKKKEVIFFVVRLGKEEYTIDISSEVLYNHGYLPEVSLQHQLAIILPVLLEKGLAKNVVRIPDVIAVKIKLRNNMAMLLKQAVPSFDVQFDFSLKPSDKKDLKYLKEFKFSGFLNMPANLIPASLKNLFIMCDNIMKNIDPRAYQAHTSFILITLQYLKILLAQEKSCFDENIYQRLERKINDEINTLFERFPCCGQIGFNFLKLSELSPNNQDGFAPLLQDLAEFFDRASGVLKKEAQINRYKKNIDRISDDVEGQYKLLTESINQLLERQAHVSPEEKQSSTEIIRELIESTDNILLQAGVDLDDLAEENADIRETIEKDQIIRLQLKGIESRIDEMKNLIRTDFSRLGLKLKKESVYLRVVESNLSSINKLINNLIENRNTDFSEAHKKLIYLEGLQKKYWRDRLSFVVLINKGKRFIEGLSNEKDNRGLLFALTGRKKLSPKESLKFTLLKKINDHRSDQDKINDLGSVTLDELYIAIGEVIQANQSRVLTTKERILLDEALDLFNVYTEFVGKNQEVSSVFSKYKLVELFRKEQLLPQEIGEKIAYLSGKYNIALREKQQLAKFKAEFDESKEALMSAAEIYEQCIKFEKSLFSRHSLGKNAINSINEARSKSEIARNKLAALVERSCCLAARLSTTEKNNFLRVIAAFKEGVSSLDSEIDSAREKYRLECQGEPLRKKVMQMVAALNQIAKYERSSSFFMRGDKHKKHYFNTVDNLLAALGKCLSRKISIERLGEFIELLQVARNELSFVKNDTTFCKAVRIMCVEFDRIKEFVSEREIEQVAGSPRPRDDDEHYLLEEKFCARSRST